MKNTYKLFLNTTILLLSLNVQADELSIYSIGKKQLILPDNIEVSLVQFDEREEEYARYWKTKLVIKVDGKITIEKFPIMKEESDTQNLFFVPIKNNKYVMDLDKNKDYEFVVTADHGGNAPSTSARVFSLKGTKLQIYKDAWYTIEGGKEVIWESSKAPTKCLFYAQGLCEYLGDYKSIKK